MEPQQQQGPPPRAGAAQALAAGGAEAEGEQQILEEEIDENYEPTDQEIRDYATWLGMDLDNEQELLWIARAGLKEPLPADWKPCRQAPSGEIYYFNFATGESIWDHPCDDHFRKLYQQEREALGRRQGDAGQGGSTQQQQQQPSAAAAVPRLHIPSSALMQHTDVESVSIPQSSPSGTLSTIHSATTASVAGSPGQQRQAAHSIFRDPSSPQHGQDAGASGWLSLSGGIAPTTSSAAGAAAAAADEVGRSSGSGDGDWRGAADAADQEQRRLYSQHLGEHRREWEQQLQAELQTQQAAVKEQRQQQLYYWAMQLEQQERDAAEQLKSAQDARLQELRSELQGTVNRLEEELQQAKQQHAAHMAELTQQQAELEGRASSMLQHAQARLSATSALSDTELAAVHDRAAAAAEAEALAETSARRAGLLKTAMQRVEQEVAAEVAAYKANRRAEAFRQLAGSLDDDTAAAAAKLERHTAELQRLEVAVADKAAVLQKLNEELSSTLQQQLQAAGDACAAAAAAADGASGGACREQLAALQQQVAQVQRQLTTADLALDEKRAAVAEAGEQLAAAKRDLAVCHPRLASLRQQLQEVEAAVRAGEAEGQQRQADLQLATRRVQELRDEAARRQAQLDSLDGLYSERQEALRQTANELAWRRGELSTLESSLSESLRRKADAEYQALEEALRRTRKGVADASAELSAKQLQLSEVSSQLSAQQVQLEGVQASLAAKSRELQQVLAQLQAAAAQEFQDARKLLLAEEARLLESERRSVQLRVADQVEAERRAALAAGRRRIERELAAQLAEEQGAMLEQQQSQVKQWLHAAGAGQPPQSVTSPAAAQNGNGSAAQANGDVPHLGSSSSPHTGGGLDSSTHAVGVAAMLQQQQGQAGPSAWQQQGEQQRQQAASVCSMPVELASPAAQGVNKQRRARSLSLSPSKPPGTAADGGSLVAALAAPQQASSNGDAHASPAPAPGAVASSSPHRAAAAVLSHLQALGAAQAPGADAKPQAAPSSPGVAAYHSLLQHAKAFTRQRRRDIQQRQAAVLAAQSDWKAVLAAMEAQQALQQQSGAPASQELGQAVAQLRQLKGVLQQQIHGLNEETRQVKALKAHVQQLKAALDLRALRQQGRQEQQQHLDLDPASSLSSLLSAVSSQQQRQQQHRSPALRHAPAAPPSPYRRPAAQGLLPPTGLAAESSLDRVTDALQAALDAAIGGRAAADGSRSSSLQPSSHGGGALDRWCEERGAAAQHAMQQHSQWLQGFRHQVCSRLQQGGGGLRGPGVSVLSPVPSQAAAPTSADPQPLTLDLGGGRVVTISVSSTKL